MLSLGPGRQPLQFDRRRPFQSAWRTPRWEEVCAAASDPSLTFSDFAHVLVELVSELPVAFKDYLWQLIDYEGYSDNPPPLEQRQRDLLPLPMISFDDDELPKRHSYTDGLVSYKSGRYAWTMLMVAAVNCEYHLATRNGATGSLGLGLARPVQYEAVKRLAVAADVMCALNPSQIGARDWAAELNASKIAYDGSESCVTERVTAKQIEAGLPPPGLAASVDILPLVDEPTRQALL